jgi:hypothetical protein
MNMFIGQPVNEEVTWGASCRVRRAILIRQLQPNSTLRSVNCCIALANLGIADNANHAAPTRATRVGTAMLGLSEKRQLASNLRAAPAVERCAQKTRPD